MKPIIFPFFDNGKIANKISSLSHFDIGKMVIHQFPDKETLIKINSEVTGRSLIFIAALDHPNSKLLPLLYATETARDLGATDIILVAPYLPYMRQDKRFNAGEGISSQYFSTLISNYFDWLVTVDPHLHRIKSLNQIYAIPSTVLHAGRAIAEWIKIEVPDPVIIGPDAESDQWVSAIVKFTGAPYLIARKNRHGDHDVEVTIPQLEKYRDHTPVLVDDIISTGKTMLAAVNCTQKLAMKPAVCIGIHALFAGNAYEELLQTGAKVISCNTVMHKSNTIDLCPTIAELLTGPLFDYT
ncbi:MAG: ribose-phosphate pyrophosphokinase [Gammaproteobacteria bacterium]